MHWQHIVWQQILIHLTKSVISLTNGKALTCKSKKTGTFFTQRRWLLRKVGKWNKSPSIFDIIKGSFRQSYYKLFHSNGSSAAEIMINWSCLHKWKWVVTKKIIHSLEIIVQDVTLKNQHGGTRLWRILHHLSGLIWLIVFLLLFCCWKLLPMWSLCCIGVMSKLQVAATATVCSLLWKVAILLCQFTPI